jgi:hypothetical protein
MEGPRASRRPGGWRAALKGEAGASLHGASPTGDLRRRGPARGSGATPLRNRSSPCGSRRRRRGAAVRWDGGAGSLARRGIPSGARRAEGDRGTWRWRRRFGPRRLTRGRGGVVAPVSSCVRGICGRTCGRGGRGT